MAASSAMDNGLQLLVFNNTAFGTLAAAGAATVLYLSLHTADPGVGGTQLTSECTYTPYARIAINRNSGGWTVTGGVVNPTVNVDFAECTAGAETATYAGVGTAASGAGTLLISGILSASIAIAAGVIPRIKSTSTITLS